MTNQNTSKPSRESMEKAKELCSCETYDHNNEFLDPCVWCVEIAKALDSATKKAREEEREEIIERLKEVKTWGTLEWLIQALETEAIRQRIN